MSERLEKDVERKLTEGIKALGGLSYKFISPGNAGVPDRIVILPGGDVVFVELKTWRGQLTVLQMRQIERLRAHDCTVRVLHGELEVERYLAELKGSPE